MPQEGFAVRPMRPDPTDIALLHAGFVRNGSTRPLEAFEWLYLRNPSGELFVDLAIADSNRLAAVYATLPIVAQVGGGTRLALQSLDTLTDADFRGRGLFVDLAKSTFERAATDHAAFIYGFPNGASAHGFFNRLGWLNLDPVPFLIRPLRTRYMLRQLKLGRIAGFFPDLALPTRGAGPSKHARAEQMSGFDERFGSVWDTFSRRIGVAVTRDRRYLTWRLVDKPGESYITLAMLRGDDLTAFVSFCVKSKHGGRVGYVMELLFTPDHAVDARHLLNRALAELTMAGADVALAWSFGHSPNFRTYLGAGFAPFPTRLRPIELHFGVRPFDPKVAHVIGDRRQWYVSYLDSDTV